MLAQDFKSFFETSKRNGIILSFGGDLSENVLFSLGEVLKLRMIQGETDATIAKRVFSIFVEQAQNIIRYSADKLPTDRASGGMISAGMIVVGVENGHFFVVCGNEIPKADAAILRERLDHIGRHVERRTQAFLPRKVTPGPR